MPTTVDPGKDDVCIQAAISDQGLSQDNKKEQDAQIFTPFWQSMLNFKEWGSWIEKGRNPKVINSLLNRL